MPIQHYLTAVEQRLKSGISREHAYRTDLETLIRTLIPGIHVTNEPANVTQSGNPDFVITRDKIPVGYIEAKDVGKNLNSKQYAEQFSRYKKALDNLILTDYLYFQFFQHGELVYDIRLAELEGDRLTPLRENFAQFGRLLRDFCAFTGQTITAPQKLAELMAGKARLLQTILYTALSEDESKNPTANTYNQANTALQEQYQTFRRILIHDLTPTGFADIYAQTLAYGMFAARLHDTNLDTFTRQEAAELIPKSNPFLRQLFQHVAGYNIDDRIRPTVDNLAELFRATDVAGLLQNFGRSTQQHDPIIHFYETFLAEYDPALRKSRGVWYTPEPVVNFIVRAVDDLLKSEFGLPEGLADTSKTTIKVKTQTADKRTKSGFREIEQEVHKVQILDPATGTGTFLAEIIKHIYHTQFAKMAGAWPSYVNEDLIPRLNGFELLMASYAMAHLKLDLLLRETGYTAPDNRRFQVYLTNTLEEHHPDTGSLFASWLSAEASEANRIKRDTPVMVVLGNPPYAVSSSNPLVTSDGQRTWIATMLDDYKKDLNERNIQPLSDDYIKFIRYGHYLVDKNGEGVLAYISNNSFIDGVIHRQMRKYLLQTFDVIYILDLHGSTKKSEVTDAGEKDENVFDIQQGVSINVFVKKSKSKSAGALADVFHIDVLGSRQFKNAFLSDADFRQLSWNRLQFQPPYFFFVPKDFSARNSYKKGFRLNRLFQVYNTGVETGRDKFFVAFEKGTLQTKVKNVFENLNQKAVLDEFKIKNTSSFRFLSDIKSSIYDDENIQEMLYRPFDTRYTYYDIKLQRRPSIEASRHILQGRNLALVSCRQQSTFDFQHVFISNTLTERCTVSLQTKETGYLFPLYLYPDDDQETFLSTDRKPNLDLKIVKQIAQGLGLTYTSEKEDTPNSFAPLDLFDYIYAVLHSPTYRETYKEFLKIDFPRVPYPTDPDIFWALVELGGELRQVHLLESPRVTQVNQFIASYPVVGSNTITRRLTKRSPGFELTDKAQGLGRVWLNDEQYFDEIPRSVWEFYIGGYQPAEKWLKDRRGRTLSNADIKHYLQIINALAETERLMQAIEAIDFL